jgi:hypothetical protein
MSKFAFWALMVVVVVFGVLAATRTIWQDPAKMTYLEEYIPKVNILPKEKSLAYEQSCSACHMLYHPSLLPARSWKKIMSGLSNHFGDNAEVEPEVAKEVSAYLQRNAADNDVNTYAEPMLNLLKDDETPMRVSDTKFFHFTHDLLRKDMVEGNPDVRSISRCEICHAEAQKGRFNRFQVRIPNYFLQGVWKKMNPNQ